MKTGTHHESRRGPEFFKCKRQKRITMLQCSTGTREPSVYINFIRRAYKQVLDSSIVR